MKLIELFSDWLLELRITLASRRNMSNSKNWQHFIGLIRKRTRASVTRIERRKGLL
ncbi:MAG: hypothetical protein ACYC4K_06160 [Thiobacillus sp.]